MAHAAPLPAKLYMVDIAQLVRVSGCGPEGRRFESGYPPHLKNKPNVLRIGFSHRIIISNSNRGVAQLVARLLWERA